MDQALIFVGNAVQAAGSFAASIFFRLDALRVILAAFVIFSAVRLLLLPLVGVGVSDTAVKNWSALMREPSEKASKRDMMYVPRIGSGRKKG